MSRVFHHRVPHSDARLDARHGFFTRKVTLGAADRLPTGGQPREIIVQIQVARPKIML